MRFQYQHKNAWHHKMKKFVFKNPEGKPVPSSFRVPLQQIKEAHGGVISVKNNWNDYLNLEMFHETETEYHYKPK